MLTFKEWILKFKEVDLPIGEFAKEVERDKHFPDSILYEELLDHLEYEALAAPFFIDSFENIYRYYLDSYTVTLLRK